MPARSSGSWQRCAGSPLVMLGCCLESRSASSHQDEVRRAFSSRPVSVSVQKSSLCLSLQVTVDQAGAKRCSRNDSISDRRVSVRRARMILPRFGNKSLASLSSSSCQLACALQCHLRAHLAADVQHRAHVKSSSRITGGPYNMSYRCRPLLRAASSLLLEIAGCA